LAGWHIQAWFRGEAGLLSHIIRTGAIDVSAELSSKPGDEQPGYQPAAVALVRQALRNGSLMQRVGCFGQIASIIAQRPGLQTRFRRKMAGIAICVLIIHAVKKPQNHRQAIYQAKRETALIPKKRSTTKSMYI